MGFTVPIDSAVTGAVAPAALWNTFVRDNLMSTMHLIARKSANQTSTSTTLANDTHLVTPTLAANEVWFLQTVLLMDTPTAADFKVGFTYPASATSRWAVVQYDAANGSAWVAVPGIAAVATNMLTEATASQQIGGAGVGSTQGVVIQAIVALAGTAGVVQPQWAQVAASGTTTVFTNSFMAGMRLSP